VPEAWMIQIPVNRSITPWGVYNVFNYTKWSEVRELFSRTCLSRAGDDGKICPEFENFGISCGEQTLNATAIARRGRALTITRPTVCGHCIRCWHTPGKSLAVFPKITRVASQVGETVSIPFVKWPLRV
jgi:hypothetical protein